MNKRLKKVLFIGLLFLFSMAFSETVFAENELSDITIEVELQEDGSGIVTEHRKIIMDEGTELYIVLASYRIRLCLIFQWLVFKR
jgi:hypothetical protein